MIGYQCGIDVDAKNYANRIFLNSGTRISREELQNISEFVKVLKELNLWQQMVCWTLRSTQNYGKGSRVEGLGNLQRFVGTMVNGPTWGLSGITLNPNTQWISVPRSFTSEHFTALGAVYNYSGNKQQVLIHYGDSSGQAISINRNMIDGTDNVGELSHSINNLAIGPRRTGLTLTGCHFLQSAINNPLSTSAISLDGVNFVPTPNGQYTIQNSRGNIRLGSSTFIPTTEAITLTFAYIINSTYVITADTQTRLYTLYRNTIGKNLGLP